MLFIVKDPYLFRFAINAFAVILQADRTHIFLIYLQLIANQNTDRGDSSSFLRVGRRILSKVDLECLRIELNIPFGKPIILKISRLKGLILIY
jgi:hypothetical protein